MAGYTVEVRKFNTAGTTVMLYILPVFETFNNSINTPVSPMPLPEEDSAEQILVKVEGNSTSVTLTWKIKDYTTDQITGSGFIGDSKTIWEQMLGIKNQFRPVSIDDAFEIAIVNAGQDVISWAGTITQMVANISSLSPVIITGTIKFMEGNVVTLYNSDGAKQPKNFTAVSGGSSGEIDLAWDLPTDTGTGSPSLTGYRIQYRTGNNEWTTEDFSPSGTSETISGLTPSSTYECRVSSSTSDSKGSFSKILNVVALA